MEFPPVISCRRRTVFRRMGVMQAVLGRRLGDLADWCRVSPSGKGGFRLDVRGCGQRTQADRLA